MMVDLSSLIIHSWNYIYLSLFWTCYCYILYFCCFAGFITFHIICWNHSQTLLSILGCDSWGARIATFTKRATPPSSSQKSTSSRTGTKNSTPHNPPTANRWTTSPCATQTTRMTSPSTGPTRRCTSQSPASGRPAKFKRRKWGWRNEATSSTERAPPWCTARQINDENISNYNLETFSKQSRSSETNLYIILASPHMMSQRCHDVFSENSRLDCMRVCIVDNLELLRWSYISLQFPNRCTYY